MSSVSGSAGHAALAICESMLLSLTENKIIDGAEAKAILADAAAAHRHSIPLVTDGGAAAHEEAASLIETILRGATRCGMPEPKERADVQTSRRLGTSARCGCEMQDALRHIDEDASLWAGWSHARWP